MRVDVYKRQMYDSAKLMGEARAQLDACGTYEEFAALLKAVHRYLIGLNFQLDNAIPWACLLYPSVMR